jgi:PTH1 family peptidyl-tRNA hydrolase
MASQRKLVVGVRTMGDRRFFNRHSIGAYALSEYARRRSGQEDPWQTCDDVSAELIHSDTSNVILAKPTTNINESGEAVRAIVDAYAIDRAQVLIIHDDLDLLIGKMLVKPSGSSAGHNGIKSIIEQLGSEQFGRLKVGIGRPPKGDSVMDYLLLELTQEEQNAMMTPMIEKMCEIIDYWIDKGTSLTMNRYNK